MLIIFYIFTFNLIYPISNQIIVPFYWHTLYISGIEFSYFAVLKFLKEQSFLSVCVLDTLFSCSVIFHTCSHFTRSNISN